VPAPWSEGLRRTARAKRKRKEKREKGRKGEITRGGSLLKEGCKEGRREVEGEVLHQHSTRALLPR